MSVSFSVGESGCYCYFLLHIPVPVHETMVTYREHNVWELINVTLIEPTAAAVLPFLGCETQIVDVSIPICSHLTELKRCHPADFFREILLDFVRVNSTAAENDTESCRRTYKGTENSCRKRQV